MRENGLLKDPLPRLFLRFVVPAMIAMVLDGIQGIVDGLFLGNYSGADAMASVNIANPYFQIIIGSSMVICTGTMSAAGRALGAGDQKRAKNIYHSALLVLAVLSILILLGGLCFSVPIARFLGANEVLLTGSSQYIRILACFAPVIAFKILFGFSGRLVEKPRLYLAGTVTTISCNVILDYLAVGVLGLGIPGAAAATGLAYLGGLLVAASPMFRRETVLNVFDGHFCPREILHAAFNGSSEGVTYAAAALTVFLMNRSFMAYAGEDGVAAFTIINYIGNFVTLLMFGMSDGISPILSSNYGAGNLDRIRKTRTAALISNFIMGAMLFGVFWIFGRQLIGLFLDREQSGTVIDMAVRGARIYGLCFLASGFNIVQSGYHTALGDAVSSILIAASRGIIFVPIGLLLFSRLLGMDGVWFSLPFAEIVTVSVCLAIHFIKNKNSVTFSPSESCYK